MNKIITVSKIEPAKRKDNSLITGVSPKTGKPWTLMNVTDSENKRYSGFSVPIDVKVGGKAFIEYEEVQNGAFTNLNITKIVAMKDEAKPVMQSVPEEIEIDSADIVNSKIGEILSLLDGVENDIAVAKEKLADL